MGKYKSLIKGFNLMDEGYHKSMTFLREYGLRCNS